MIDQIIQKYNAKRNNWYPLKESPYKYDSAELRSKEQNECLFKEKKLLKKYSQYIPKGWYGFSFGSPTPLLWFDIIDEVLEYFTQLQNQNRISNFEIHQIKMKFGGLRFYVSWETKDEKLTKSLDSQIDKLENCLHDDKLIY